MDLINLFSCGSDPRQIEEKFLKLPIGDQKRLNKVVERAWVTLLLRYDINIGPDVLSVDGGNWAEYKLSMREIPSIELYLLFSCLDTLAGPSHKYFEDWLNDYDINSNVSKEEIKEIYGYYNNEHGVSKNLKELFLNLPKATKIWLKSNVKILKEKEYMSIEKKEIGMETFTKRLFNFYYQFRNSFTHQGISKPLNISREIYDPKPDNGWRISPSFIMDHHKPNQYWRFFYRPGIDEATILRVILFSAVLQKLGITVTENHISAHMEHLSRVNSFRNFIDEVRSNAHYLEALSKINEEEFFELNSRIFHNGFPCLNQMSIFVAVRKFNRDFPFESGMFFMARDYFRRVVEVNKRIIAFNKIYLKMEVDNTRRAVIDKFIEELINDTYVREIIKWTERNEIRNLWQLIRNPCYV